MSTSSRACSAGTLVVVEVRGDEDGPGLLRAAAAYASSVNAPWLAVAVRTPEWGDLPAYDRSRMEEQLLLARHLGAETVVSVGERADETLLSVARAYGGTQIVALLPRQGPGHREAHRELRSLLERGGDFPFHLVEGTADDPPAERR